LFSLLSILSHPIQSSQIAFNFFPLHQPTFSATYLCLLYGRHFIVWEEKEKKETNIWGLIALTWLRFCLGLIFPQEDHLEVFFVTNLCVTGGLTFWWGTTDLDRHDREETYTGTIITSLIDFWSFAVRFSRDKGEIS